MFEREFCFMMAEALELKTYRWLKDGTISCARGCNKKKELVHFHCRVAGFLRDGLERVLKCLRLP